MSNCVWFPASELSGEGLSNPNDNAAEWKMMALEFNDMPPAPPAPVTPGSSFFIHRNDLFRVYEGVRFANYMGVVLNVELSVCWECAEYEGDEAVDEAYRMFVDRFRKFTHYRGFEPYFWATFERGPVVGIHSHMSLHIKDQWASEFRRWLPRALIDAYGERMLPSDYSARVHAERHITSQWRWFQYGFKGLDPALNPEEQSQYPIGTTLNELAGVRQAYTGPLSLKRVRMSRTMTESAHKRANYTVMKSLADLRRGEQYNDAEYRRGVAAREQAETFKSLNRLNVI